MKHEAMTGMTSGSASANPLRVLMAYWDGGGNLPPQRSLARELKRRRHDVHVLTRYPGQIRCLRRCDIPFAGNGPSMGPCASEYS